MMNPRPRPTWPWTRRFIPLYKSRPQHLTQFRQQALELAQAAPTPYST
jgi:hypothetical protein